MLCAVYMNVLTKVAVKAMSERQLQQQAVMRSGAAKPALCKWQETSRLQLQETVCEVTGACMCTVRVSVVDICGEWACISEHLDASSRLKQLTSELKEVVCH